MPDNNSDGELLKLHVRGDPTAFSQIVGRHSPLVYSAAIRQTRDPHMAEEITQAVFILLSAKARKLGGNVILSAWLYRAARFAAKDAMKKQRRRQYHESQAAISVDVTTGKDELTRPWSDVAPLLDGAMESLCEKDRSAIVMRFFEGRSLKDVGGALGATEGAAGQRVSRAIDRLRRFFSSRGVIVPTANLAGILMTRAVAPPPAGLIESVTRAVAAPSAALTLISKGVAKMLFWTQPKVIGTFIAVIITAVAIPASILVSGSHADGTPLQQPPTPSAQPLSVALLDGGTLQVCLTDMENGSKRFWNPDGTALNLAGYQLVLDRPQDALKPDIRRVGVLIRAVDSHGQNIAEGFSGNNAHSVGLAGAHLEKDGKKQEGWWVQVFTISTNQHGFESDLGLSYGDFHTLAVWGTYGQTGKILTNDRGYMAEAGIPAARDGELDVAMAIQLPQVTDWDARLIAVLKDGKRQPDSTRLNTRLMGGVGMTSFVFWRDLAIKPDDVKNYELQIRPHMNVILRDLPPAPGIARKPNIQIVPPHPMPKFKA